MVREYELGLVINPDLNDEQIEAQILRVGQGIESRDGEILKLDRWGRRRMSYPISRHREGYYAFLSFKADSNTLREIERLVLVQEEIMRHLIVFLDPRATPERQRREQEIANARANVAANAAAQMQQHPHPLPPAPAPVPAEIPVAEAPVVETPVAETPAVEAPAAETPAPATPADIVPASEEVPSSET